MSSSRFVSLSTCALASLTSIMSTGCKKEVDPSAFDSGAPSTVATATSSASVDASVAAASTDDAAAPLASLAPAIAPPPVAHAVKKNLPECAEARRFCNHPAVKTDAAIQNLCTQNKQSCFAKGGTL